MQQYIALLRGINVGGHRVKMTDLRALFEALGFAGVATFIASGNVVFDAPDGDEAQLQTRIERHLRDSLGYEVATFLRTPAELAAVAAHEPFPDLAYGPDTHTLSVMFVAAPPPADLRQRIHALRTPADDFHVHRREIYWLCRGKTMDSLVDWPLVGRTLPLPPTTVRNITTVRKLAAKYPPDH